MFLCLLGQGSDPLLHAGKTKPLQDFDLKGFLLIGAGGMNCVILSPANGGAKNLKQKTVSLIRRDASLSMTSSIWFVSGYCALPSACRLLKSANRSFFS